MKDYPNRWKVGMSRNEWLCSATLDMPDSVRSRVQAETFEHLEEAGALQATDVRDILGLPQTVNRELRRLYLTEKEWQNYATKNDLYGLIEWLSVAVWPAMLVWAQMKGTSSPAALPASYWLLLGLFLVSLTTFTLGTQKLHALRRRQWRYIMVILSSLALQWPYFANLPGLHVNGETSWSASLLLSVILGFALVRSIRTDQKLSRTIKMEGYEAQARS